jgi:hypothetical protein
MGADINSEDKNKFTTLHYSVASGSLSSIIITHSKGYNNLASICIKNGSNWELKDVHGRTGTFFFLWVF